MIAERIADPGTSGIGETSLELTILCDGVTRGGGGRMTFHLHAQAIETTGEAKGAGQGGSARIVRIYKYGAFLYGEPSGLKGTTKIERKFAGSKIKIFGGVEEPSLFFTKFYSTRQSFSGG